MHHLVVFEDLHWIDSETQACLEGLMESLPSARLLLLVNYRPEFSHSWGNEGSYTQLRLDTLRPESTAELLGALLGPDPSLESLKRLISQGAAGNPLFIEESIRALVETNALLGGPGSYRLAQPIETIHVPATVQAILAARIDRLSPEDKRLLETAAVIGKDFPFALLQVIAGAQEDALRLGLGRLQAAEFLYETSLFPDLVYTFKHALTHEVAYGSMLRERRRALHRAIVDAIELLYAERLSVYVERLAHHATRGDEWDKAARYLYSAGLKAYSRSAGADARQYYDEALMALQKTPKDEEFVRFGIDVRLGLPRALFLLGELDQGEQWLIEAQSMARALEDGVREARSAAFLCGVRWQRGDLRRAHDEGGVAKALAERHGDDETIVYTTTQLAYIHHCLGDYRRADDYCTEVLERVSRRGDSDSATQGPLALVPFFSGGFHMSRAAAVRVLAFRGASKAERGAFDAGWEDAMAGVGTADQIDQPFSHGMGAWGVAFLSRLRGDLERAEDVLVRALTIARDWKLEWWLAHLGWLLGHVHVLGGRRDGIPELREALHRFEAHQFGSFRSLVMVNLGEANLLAGDVVTAHAIALEALDRTRAQGEKGHEAWALRLLGEATAARDDVAASDGVYRDALELATELDMRPVSAHCHAGLARLYRRTDKRAQAQEHFVTATTMYREMGMTYWLEKAEAEMTKPGG